MVGVCGGKRKDGLSWWGEEGWVELVGKKIVCEVRIGWMSRAWKRGKTNSS